MFQGSGAGINSPVMRGLAGGASKATREAMTTPHRYQRNNNAIVTARQTIKATIGPAKSAPPVADNAAARVATEDPLRSCEAARQQ